jgi:hypothetical protein
MLLAARYGVMGAKILMQPLCLFHRPDRILPNRLPLKRKGVTWEFILVDLRSLLSR